MTDKENWYDDLGKIPSTLMKDLTLKVEQMFLNTGKKYKTRDLSVVNKIVVHCADRDWTIPQLLEFDKTGYLSYTRKIDGEKVTDVNQIDSSGLPGPTYHEAVLKRGGVYQLLPYESISWHAGGYNTKSVSICLIYRATDPVTGKDTYGPTQDQIKSLRARCGALCLKFGLTPDRVFGHRELKGTGWIPGKYGSKRLRKTCPGLQVDMDDLRLWTTKYMQIMLKGYGLYEGKVDGAWGPKSQAALNEWKSK